MTTLLNREFLRTHGLPLSGGPSADRDELYDVYRDRIRVNPALDRSLVSFQANKGTRFCGWFKYKEGFSEALVKYLLTSLHPEPGILLDPFAGSGAALFAAAELGWEATGVELLPVGLFIAEARHAARYVNSHQMRAVLGKLENLEFALMYDEAFALRHVAITHGAIPTEEERQLVGYLAYCNKNIPAGHLRTLLLFAAFSVLEDISYTRKDGQYLRWDSRSGRQQGKKPFTKGPIPLFKDALFRKLRRMALDLQPPVEQAALFPLADADRVGIAPAPCFRSGSCLEILPAMSGGSYDFILTSPPYANRYDYTRTYALELVYLGCGDEDIKRLRQTMLSCTVENRDKIGWLRQLYGSLGYLSAFGTVDRVFHEQAALQEVLSILDSYRKQGLLNNDNVSRMVRNYFYEMSFVVYELSRILRSGGVVAMVNDNVRYAGEEIPVDLILSSFAESFGLHAEVIWTLERGKGNSSQQMGHHGRSELRKCVYVWRKP
ncbi:MAG: site-specific DNA-methyltransferase [Chloroflexi bacterium]|nr:site-specific DNA-methyltransferase [Chloroflexota bacterium]